MRALLADQEGAPDGSARGWSAGCRGPRCGTSRRASARSPARPLSSCTSSRGSPTPSRPSSRRARPASRWCRCRSACNPEARRPSRLFASNLGYVLRSFESHRAHRRALQPAADLPAHRRGAGRHRASRCWRDFSTSTSPPVPVGHIQSLIVAVILIVVGRPGVGGRHRRRPDRRQPTAAGGGGRAAARGPRPDTATRPCRRGSPHGSSGVRSGSSAPHSPSRW